MLMGANTAGDMQMRGYADEVDVQMCKLIFFIYNIRILLFQVS